MVPILLAGPAQEPLTLDEARAHLRLDHTGEDALVGSLVKAARLTVEAAARRILVETRWKLRLDRWPVGRVLRLPLSPLISVETVRVVERGGAWEVLDPALVAAEADHDPPLVRIDPLAPEPGRAQRGIEIELLAGYGSTAEALPEPLRQAVRILVAHWFENRGDRAALADPPPDLAALVAPFRSVRL